MRWVRLIFVLLLLACLAPAAMVAIAGGIASRYGCTLNEGAINPCVINGVDYGHDLYSLGMAGWLMIVTLPLAALLAALWLVMEIVRKWRMRTPS